MTENNNASGVHETTTSETKQGKTIQRERVKQGPTAWKHSKKGGAEMEGREEVMGKAVEMADDEAPCYHLLQKKLELDRLKGY